MSLSPKPNKSRTQKTDKPTPRVISRRGRIENWNAGHVGPFGEISWAHESGDWDVDIENPYHGEWVVTVTGPDKDGIIIDENSTNETEAREIAIDWMRRHPNPPLEEPYVFREKKVVPWTRYNKVSWQRNRFIIKIEHIRGEYWVKLYKDHKMHSDLYQFKSQEGAERFVENLIKGNVHRRYHRKIAKMINR